MVRKLASSPELTRNIALAVLGEVALVHKRGGNLVQRVDV